MIEEFALRETSGELQLLLAAEWTVSSAWASIVEGRDPRIKEDLIQGFCR